MEKYPPRVSNRIKELAKYLQESFKLSDFEALTLPSPSPEPMHAI
jgi:hypothetical protein